LFFFNCFSSTLKARVLFARRRLLAPEACTARLRSNTFALALTMAASCRFIAAFILSALLVAALAPEATEAPVRFIWLSTDFADRLTLLSNRSKAVTSLSRAGYALLRPE